MPKQDEEQFRKLGRHVVRMIHDVNRVSRGETGYARQTITYPGGEVTLFVVNDPQLADLFEKAAADRYEVAGAVPPSTLN